MTRVLPRPGLREVEPYASPQLEVAARLNTNECPYPLPGAFREALARRIAELPLNRYPDRDVVALRTRLAEAIGRPLDGVWAANGSNEILLQLLQAYGGAGRRAVVFEPTYALHSRLSWVTQTEVAAVGLGEPWAISPDDVERAAAAGPDVVFVCSPNNPTGTTHDASTAAALADSTNALVVVDEAYVEFGGATVAHVVDTHPNVVVVRTFSKAFALAGARIGYCLADPQVVRDLMRVRLPYHVGTLTEVAGLVALAHRDEAAEILDAIREQRDRILTALPAIGVEAFPSSANFVLFRPPVEARRVWQGLLDRGVLVRDMTDTVPNALRVTAGTPEEIDLFLTALEEVLT
jgi:histidinol-phosphate aminotransferase